MFSESRTIIDIKYLCEPQYEKEEGGLRSFQIFPYESARLSGSPGLFQGHVAAARKRSHQWYLTLTPNNTETIERMTCHCFLRPVRRDLTSISYTTVILLLSGPLSFHFFQQFLDRLTMTEVDIIVICKILQESLIVKLLFINRSNIFPTSKHA